MSKRHTSLAPNIMMFFLLILSVSTLTTPTACFGDKSPEAVSDTSQDTTSIQTDSGKVGAMVNSVDGRRLLVRVPK